MSWDGKGVAKDYDWTEDAAEIEVRLRVPRDTRAKQVRFQAKPQSIDLRLSADDGMTETILLDGNRTLRGRLALDGTFWNLEDDEATGDKIVVVTLEKNTRAPRDDFEFIDYDWGGVYPDDAEEVLSRMYVEPEELNVREYAASMGVDIDNINMSLVDKNMFSSGLNMTRQTVEQLTKHGYLQEVTQQADGSEYTVNTEGESVPYSSLGEGISQDELQEASKKGKKIPFLDTESPWSSTVPYYNMEEIMRDVDTAAKHSGRDGFGEDPEQEGQKISSEILGPIDLLTVNRLKEALRQEGLKVSGSKAELQQRLKDHIRHIENNSIQEYISNSNRI